MKKLLLASVATLATVSAFSALAADLDAVAPRSSWVLQAEQKGTGHAVRVALSDLSERGVSSLVAAGNGHRVTLFEDNRTL